MRIAYRSLITLAVMVAGCGADRDPEPHGDAGTDGDADVDGGDTLPGERFTSSVLVEGPVITAVGGNLEEDGPMRIVVALESGGLAAFASEAGELVPVATELTDEVFTSLAIARLDDSGRASVVALSEDETVYAIDPADLGVLWSEGAGDLSSAGDVVPGDQDGDGDHDVAAMSADNVEMINFETRDGAWPIRDRVGLPSDILSIAAGDLGGSAHDEYLFLGTGGLVEAVTIGDFNYIDDRFLAFTSHALAVFGDFDGDGDGDVAITTPAEVELWTGDGDTHITLLGSTAVSDAPIQDLAVIGGEGSAGLVVVDRDGGLVLVQFDENGEAMLGSDELSSSPEALRIVVGDVDDDGTSDAVVVAADGRAYTWRNPQ